MTTLITRADVERHVAARTAVLVDALPAGYYERQHLPGAVNLVESDVADRAAELLPDRAALIVTYCSNAACGNSQAVATRLTQLGYTDVRKYREGIQDWVEAGNPTEPAA